MQVLKRENLPDGGFAGLKEHQLVKDPMVFGPNTNDDGSWSGLARFVYLADARFMPNGETRMHSHKEVDVISVMVKGRISHQGSMGHGQDLQGSDVQVQRAGGEGFSHNEVNPDDEWNRMLQLWVLPEQPGMAADYKVYEPKPGELTRIYGGDAKPASDFPSQTKIDVAVLDVGQSVEVSESFVAYLSMGKGLLNGASVEEGDLVRGETLRFEAIEPVQLIVVHI